jgi:hypothetical protein
MGRPRKEDTARRDQGAGSSGKDKAAGEARPRRAAAADAKARLAGALPPPPALPPPIAPPTAPGKRGGVGADAAKSKGRDQGARAARGRGRGHEGCSGAPSRRPGRAAPAGHGPRCSTSPAPSPTPAGAAAAAPSRRLVAPRGKRGRVARTFTMPDGETLAAGEDYYIEMDGFDPDEHGDDEDEPCEVCGRPELLGGMLECGQCLRGFHLRCLRPPLKRIPEGEWLCPQVRAWPSRAGGGGGRRG